MLFNLGLIVRDNALLVVSFLHLGILIVSTNTLEFSSKIFLHLNMYIHSFHQLTPAGL